MVIFITSKEGYQGIKFAPMCITDKKVYVFHSFEYSLTLQLSKSGGLSGYLTVLLDSDNIKYSLSGFYLSRNELVEFTFFTEWKSNEENLGLTCFSGHFVNDQILIVDWIIFDESDTFGITGSDFLYSSTVPLKERTKFSTSIRPFPVEAGLLNVRQSDLI